MMRLFDPANNLGTTFCVSLRSILKKWNDAQHLLVELCWILFIELSGENLYLTISRVVTPWDI
jgi:hypothetical protein